MKKVLFGAGGVLVLVVGGLLLVWSNLNTIVKKGIETVGPRVLQAPVTVAEVDLEVTGGRGVIRDLVVGNPAGFQTAYAFKLTSVEVELDTATVTSDTVRIKRIIIDSPDIIYEGRTGASNLEQLQANALEFAAAVGGQREDESSGAGKKVVIDQLRIVNGKIGLSPALLQGRTLTVPLPTIELRDLGKEKETTMAEAVSQVLTAINRSALPAIRQGLSTLGEGARSAGEAVREGAERGVEGIRGLFGR